jgi:hypothetical protein
LEQIDGGKNEREKSDLSSWVSLEAILFHLLREKVGFLLAIIPQDWPRKANSAKSWNFPLLILYSWSFPSFLSAAALSAEPISH